MHRIPVLMMVLLGGVGCGGEAEDASPDAAAEADASSTCHAWPNTAELVEQTRVAEDMPAPLGGSLPDGEYYLAGDIIYTGVGGATGGTGAFITATSRMTDGVSQYTVEYEPDVESYEVYELVPSGTSITITRTCPDDFVVTYDAFTGTSEAIVLYDTAAARALEFLRVP
jgi:hypothetical protein